MDWEKKSAAAEAKPSKFCHCMLALESTKSTAVTNQCASTESLLTQLLLVCYSQFLVLLPQYLQQVLVCCKHNRKCLLMFISSFSLFQRMNHLLAPRNSELILATPALTHTHYYCYYYYEDSSEILRSILLVP